LFPEPGPFPFDSPQSTERRGIATDEAAAALGMSTLLQLAMALA
jgi:hypothetical protein